MIYRCIIPFLTIAIQEGNIQEKKNKSFPFFTISNMLRRITTTFPSTSPSYDALLRHMRSSFQVAVECQAQTNKAKYELDQLHKKHPWTRDRIDIPIHFEKTAPFQVTAKLRDFGVPEEFLCNK